MQPGTQLQPAGTYGRSGAAPDHDSTLRPRLVAATWSNGGRHTACVNNQHAVGGGALGARQAGRLECCDKICGADRRRGVDRSTVAGGSVPCRLCAARPFRGPGGRPTSGAVLLAVGHGPSKKCACQVSSTVMTPGSRAGWLDGCRRRGWEDVRKSDFPLIRVEPYSRARGGNDQKFEQH